MSRMKSFSRDFPKGGHIAEFQSIRPAIASIDIQSRLKPVSFVKEVRQLLPNLGIYTVATTLHLSQYIRTSDKDDESSALLVALSGIVAIDQANSNPVYCQPGDALLVPADSVCRAHVPDAISVAIVNVSTVAVAPAVSSRGGEYLMEKVVCASTPELRLLVSFIRVLMQLGSNLLPDFISLVSMQINDLAAQLLNTKCSKTKTIDKHDLRAVRLKAIRRDIVEHITDSKLSINQVAQRMGMSPQYIRGLLHSEKTTFTDYVVGLRLERIYWYLQNPAYANRSISSLAFDLGFNNLSWFNRVFKQRFNLTPSEVRNLSQQSIN